MHFPVLNLRYILTLFGVLVVMASCQKQPQKSADTVEFNLKEYLTDASERIKDGGIKLIKINSFGKDFTVWTKRTGNNPKIKLLLLTGGPGSTHEYFECMDSFLPAEGIEYYYYDQLGTGHSDNPDDEEYWDLDRYVEEVEQVRQALGLNQDNFYVLGHSWGGLLAMQYALKYQEHLKGLMISNMMSSIPEYNEYASTVLAEGMPEGVVDSIKLLEKNNDYKNPHYMGLLIPHFYEKHVLRLPFDQWPEPFLRSSKKTNESLYVTMQGPSEFGASGKLENWDIKSRLKEISVPTLTIGAKHDTMDPKHMEWMAKEVQNGSYLYCPNGSHMAFYDDQKVYMGGIIKFMKEVNQSKKEVTF